VRVREDSEAAVVIGRFASIWQQGDLPHVDERRRQYQALYGFPLHIAARWGQLDTVDPRHSFPPAFHGFLGEALRYFRETRNLQILPDIQPVRAAFDVLVDALREGNENLRRVRPPELRAQIEYSKQVLGGSNPVPIALSNLSQEWSRALPMRPGVAQALHPWQNAVNTVAMLYRWQRPNVAEYTKLAEHGELILVLCRIVGDAIPSPTPAAFESFITLMKDPIQTYANAYKTVAQVDLNARGAFLGAPAEAMARHIQPPVIPPLKRSWAAEVPVLV
jgi:hypothetical protein